MSEFIFFPSFSAGAMVNQLQKGLKLDNGLTIRFYSEEFPERYRHPEILITAGHHYKDDDYKNDLVLTDKNLVSIDIFDIYVNISLNIAYIHFVNISKDIFLIFGGLSTVCDLLKMPFEKV